MGNIIRRKLIDKVHSNLTLLLHSVHYETLSTFSSFVFIDSFLCYYNNQPKAPNEFFEASHITVYFDYSNGKAQ